MDKIASQEYRDHSVSELERQRVRVVYEKGEAIKFVSHQDEFRLWERTLRRADLPLLYSQGFNPQPQLQFASPLGVGITGINEFLDITFSPPTPTDALAERIRASLPPGVTMCGIEEIPLKSESLHNLLIGSDYTILIFAEPGEIAPALLRSRIDACLQRSEIWRERERKGEKYIYNLRPLIFELQYQGYDAEREEHRIFLRVQQRAGATGRPDEVVAALDLEDFARTLRRDRLYFRHQPEDAALFAAYPIISQELIAHPDNIRRRRRGRRRESTHPKPGKTGRSISERAGDEFV
jgi:radical SAM-linked protein